MFHPREERISTVVLAKHVHAAKVAKDSAVVLDVPIPAHVDHAEEMVQRAQAERIGERSPLLLMTGEDAVDLVEVIAEEVLIGAVVLIDEMEEYLDHEMVQVVHHDSKREVRLLRDLVVSVPVMPTPLSSSQRGVVVQESREVSIQPARDQALSDSEMRVVMVVEGVNAQETVPHSALHAEMEVKDDSQRSDLLGLTVLIEETVNVASEERAAVVLRVESLLDSIVVGKEVAQVALLRGAQRVVSVDATLDREEVRDVLTPEVALPALAVVAPSGISDAVLQPAILGHQLSSL